MANFIHCLPPEKPRDIANIPSILPACKDDGYREEGVANGKIRDSPRRRDPS